MRWVSPGPDLPAKLLQLAEDGRLVFFCGAGVSSKAGLPGFKALVERIFKDTGELMSDLEEQEFKSHNFDLVLHLLEQRIGYRAVRKAVIEALRLEPTADLSTHQALLDLAKTKDGAYRLVTTNFDLGFELAAQGKGFPSDIAPKLPVPKPGLWNSVVYLHGRICDADPEGRSLVLTSADFGKAYLTESWATRFLTELFRHFAVVFVGYSLGDPVVRYIMDALAADRAAGLTLGEAFIFDGCPSDERIERKNFWKARGLIPLFYDPANDHAALHNTLIKWAECHRHGLLGKESIILQHASKAPRTVWKEDPAVSQVLWALREDTGRVAAVFAKLDPPPPLEWLPALEAAGLLSLPAPDTQPGSGAPERQVPLVGGGRSCAAPPRLHPTTQALGQWLRRHLDNPRLLEWVLRSGAVLHPEFRYLVREQLREGVSAPHGLVQVWKLLASEGQIVALTNPYEIIQTLELERAIASGDWDLPLKHELLRAFEPKLELRPSLLRAAFREEELDGDLPSSFVDYEVVCQCGKEGLLSLAQAISTSPSKDRILAALAEDLTDFVKRAMELFEMVGGADAKHDPSYSDRPSISDHPQNHNFANWSILIDLCRDAWKSLLQINPAGARMLVERWKTIPYPVFRRLCFFAMANSNFYAPRECLDYLLDEEGWWLWSVYVHREKFRLLASIWPRLAEEDARRLVDRILLGPPRSMFRRDLDQDEFRAIVEREIWVHLTKLNSWRCLPPPGQEKLLELSTRHPEWRLQQGDRDEFVVYVESGVAAPPIPHPEDFLTLSDDQVLTRLEAAPLSDQALQSWTRLLEKSPERACRLLRRMAERNVWRHDLWRVTLAHLAADEAIFREPPELLAVLVEAPEPLIADILYPLTQLLSQAAAVAAQHESSLFWNLWDRAAAFAFRQNQFDLTDPLFQALNSPAGRLTGALLDYVAAKQPERPSDLSPEIWDRLTRVATGEGSFYTLARVLLASRVAWFHQLHPTWTTQNLIPHFDWASNPEEAQAIWHGYFSTARVTPELWPVIKQNFLAALKFFGGSEYHGRLPIARQACHLFALICVHRPDWFTEDEIKSALRSLSADGRAAVAWMLWKQLEHARDRSQTLWGEVIGPLLQRLWPKDLIMRDAFSSAYLAISSIYAGDLFARAVDTIIDLLLPAAPALIHLLVERLLESGLATREPSATLKLLARVVDTNEPQFTSTLRQLLDQISAADPALKECSQFRTLDEYLRRYGL